MSGRRGLGLELALLLLGLSAVAGFRPSSAPYRRESWARVKSPRTHASLLSVAPLLGLKPVYAVDDGAAAGANSFLPGEIRQALTEMKECESPEELRDAVKKLAETGGLDELYYDETARETVNTELKEFQRERPDLWAPEALYYGGIVRRTVNPYHIIELKPWLQVGPFVGGAGYLFAIFVQRKAPQFFALAYFAAVASVVVPAAYLILS